MKNKFLHKLLGFVSRQVNPLAGYLIGVDKFA